MKKLKQILFNNKTGILLLLLLQLAVIVFIAIIFSFPEEWGFARFLSNIILIGLKVIEIIIFFVILNKPLNSELKMPWVILILALPLCGMVFYGINGIRNLFKKYQVEIPKIKVDENELEINYEKYGDCAKLFSYLAKNNNFYPTSNTKIKYYKNGETFFPEFLDYLKKAKKVILLEFFIISDTSICREIFDILIEKVKEGVDVKLLYDEVGSLGKISSKYIKRLKKEGIEVITFNRISYILTSIYNNRDHRKICVIDNEIGFTGGMNLSDEYANRTHPFGYWKDVMVKIEGPLVQSLTDLFSRMYYVYANKTQKSFSYLTHKYKKFDEDGYSVMMSDGPSPFYKEKIGSHSLLFLIESAREEINISTPYFIPYESILNAIRRAALSGVKVNLFLPGIPDKKMLYSMAQTYFRTLISSGVNIYIYKKGFNHEKCILVDGKSCFLGTVNLDYRSLIHNFECGVFMYKTTCLKDINADFIEMREESEKVASDFKLPKIKAVFCALIKLFLPLL